MKLSELRKDLQLSDQLLERDDEIIITDRNALTSGSYCDVLLHFVLSNQCNVQILDVQHKPIKTFVSGLSLQFLPTPTLLLRKGCRICEMVSKVPLM